MINRKLYWWLVGVLNGFIFGATIVSARGIDLKNAGITFWVFILVFLIIVLLQAIPATILIFSWFLSRRRK